MVSRLVGHPKKAELLMLLQNGRRKRNLRVRKIRRNVIKL